MNNHFGSPWDKKNDISIIGEGSSAGGAYGKVKVVGDSTFNDNLFCEQFKCTGTSVIYGSLESTDIKITGTLTLTERAAGYESEGGNPVSGLHAKAEKMKVVGEIHLSGDCQAENFKLNGRFTIAGMLSAEQMTIKVMGPSEVREIGGSIISVKSGRGKLLEGLFTGNQSILTANLIEGDEIELENTVAEVVRGDEIKIGPGCRIGTVEYNSSLQIHSQSEVLVQRNRSLD
ncbi:hypothetical protein [Paenibacillus xylanilyticus]|uniref:Polymer-forming cytoskeletal protein n=1 Tax=Paenibacillus xylanilyticus TaxID=248903 RepID=A0A7Y6BUU8_9BACL|nr:hypothetical protein [Paenibacillus xylanilyticus]NUU74851.1 hypothetical protein [Paenibacillus xylanilyticus]